MRGIVFLYFNLIPSSHKTLASNQQYVQEWLGKQFDSASKMFDNLIYSC